MSWIDACRHGGQGIIKYSIKLEAVFPERTQNSEKSYYGLLLLSLDYYVFLLYALRKLGILFT